MFQPVDPSSCDHVSSSFRVAVTGSHRLGNMKKRNSFLTVLQAGSPRSRGPRVAGAVLLHHTMAEVKGQENIRETERSELAFITAHVCDDEPTSMLVTFMHS